LTTEKARAIRQIHDVAEGFTLGDAVGEPRGIFVGIAGEAAALNSVPKKIAKRAVRPNDFRGKCIQLYVTLIAEN
jgi:hypothetical protein